MRLSHVNITMPAGNEAAARAFYGGLLGLREIPKPEAIRGRGGVWFEAGGWTCMFPWRKIAAEPMSAGISAWNVRRSKAFGRVLKKLA